MGEWVSASAGLDVLQKRKTIYHFGQLNHALTDLRPSLYIPTELLRLLTEQNAIPNIT